MREKILETLRTKQAWRPESENLYLLDWNEQQGIPFCFECGDWHKPEDQHSYVENEECPHGLSLWLCADPINHYPRYL